jgi:L-lactate dehydrogenase
VIAGKGATNYAVGLAVTAILQAVLSDEGRVLPVSSLINDYCGLRNVCLSMPAIVNRNGVDSILPVPLNDEEQHGLQASAEAILSVAHSLGF